MYLREPGDADGGFDLRLVDDRMVEGRAISPFHIVNALPQFITEIDGLDIQFAHIHSPHDDALPLLVTPGSPGSIIELLKVIDPLADPTAHAGCAEDAFHLVLPTLPGYGFSEKQTSTGWNPVASAFHELMLRLGYPRYVARGGGWGATIVQLLAIQAPEGLLGTHVDEGGHLAARQQPEHFAEEIRAAFRPLRPTRRGFR